MSLKGTNVIMNQNIDQNSKGRGCTPTRVVAFVFATDVPEMCNTLYSATVTVQLLQHKYCSENTAVKMLHSNCVSVLLQCLYISVKGFFAMNKLSPFLGTSIAFLAALAALCPPWSVTD